MKMDEGFWDEPTMEKYFCEKFKIKPPAEKIIKDTKEPDGPSELLKENALGEKYWDFFMWISKDFTHHLTLRHMDKIPDGNRFDCDGITDEWFRWFLSTPKRYNPYYNPGNIPNPYADANAFLFNENSTPVYFATASPFQNPDFRRIVLTEKAHLLVPVFNAVTSPTLYKSGENDVEKFVFNILMNDLTGIKKESVKAQFDGEPLYGCTVIREKPIEIKNIPEDNVYDIPIDRLRETNFCMKIHHGGAWLLINRDYLTSGDHLLVYEAKSRNYEISAKLFISALT
jgi:hypothetical protein